MYFERWKFPGKSLEVRGGPLDYKWMVTKNHLIVAEGRAWTRESAWKKATEAAKRVPA